MAPFNNLIFQYWILPRAIPYLHIWSCYLTHCDVLFLCKTGSSAPKMVDQRAKTSKHKRRDDVDENQQSQTQTRCRSWFLIYYFFYPCSNGFLTADKQSETSAFPSCFNARQALISKWSQPDIFLDKSSRRDISSGIWIQDNFTVELRRATLIGRSRHTQRMKEMNPSFHHSSEITPRRKVTQEPALNKLLCSFGTVIHTSCICEWLKKGKDGKNRSKSRKVASPDGQSWVFLSVSDALWSKLSAWRLAVDIDIDPHSDTLQRD